jgi:hypothetical protein
MCAKSKKHIYNQLVAKLLKNDALQLCSIILPM